MPDAAPRRQDRRRDPGQDLHLPARHRPQQADRHVRRRLGDRPAADQPARRRRARRSVPARSCITLTTCAELFHTDNRMIAFGHLVDTDRPAETRRVSAMVDADLARDIDSCCRLTGEFTLRSGQVAREYFDKYLFEAQPALLRRVVEQMVDLVPEGTELLGGLELGGIPIATVLSSRTGPAGAVRAQAGQGVRHLQAGRGPRRRGPPGDAGRGRDHHRWRGPRRHPGAARARRRGRGRASARSTAARRAATRSRTSTSRSGPCSPRPSSTRSAAEPGGAQPSLTCSIFCAARARSNSMPIGTTETATIASSITSRLLRTNAIWPRK